jgi:phage terminase large subunit
MGSARIELPPKLIPVFDGQARYRGAYGGRGSGKSYSFALMAAVRGYAAQTRILCARELQNSLKDSVHAEIRAAIEAHDWLKAHYEIGESYIRGKNGTEFIFKGLRHNYQQIKSTHGVGICWVEEAETVSEASWKVLVPTIRAPGSEIWLTWNPEDEDSATHKRFILTPPDGAKIARLNHNDNPWFPVELESERLQDLSRDPDYYAHVWEGECISRRDAQVLAGKWHVEEFTPQSSWDGPYYGLDWGFASDPTAAVKCWSYDGCLWIEEEAGKVGLELDDTVAYLSPRLSGISAHTVRADCSRPESISYVKRNGMPRCVPVRKWAGSVEDGIQHLRSYRKIIVHPRCQEVARECRLYSYKVDRLSGDILPVPLDANNHYMDAIRYALEPLIGSGLEQRKTNKVKPAPELDAWGRRREGEGSWKTM